MTILKLSLTILLCGAIQALPWIPAPRDATWMETHQMLLNRTRDHLNEVKAVFLGDSITRRWATTGNVTWDKFYAPRGAFNYGVGGDSTEHVIWRIDHGELNGLKPKVVVLKIGTNNIPHDNAGAIAQGIMTILERLHKTLPDAKVILCSVLPRNTVSLDTEVHDINQIISTRFADNQRVFYMDLAAHFEISLAREKAELYDPDHLHLSSKGYVMWHEVMEPTFAKLIA